MRPQLPVRRVVVVVLDGLRPDAIDRFDLHNIGTLMYRGAATRSAMTVTPSLTVAAMTSLLTGASPSVHGLASDRLFIPRAKPGLSPLPEFLGQHGFPSSGFMSEVPAIFRGIASRIGRRLGFSALHLAGGDAAGILAASRSMICTQRRGLILLHWPDADRAGHDFGWMATEYGEAAKGLDAALGLLAAWCSDPETVLIALADHGGGGVSPKDHDAFHPINQAIPLMLHGAAITRCDLGRASLLDIPSTVLYALGLSIPSSYEGEPLRRAFVGSDAPISAVA